MPRPILMVAVFAALSSAACGSDESQVEDAFESSVHAFVEGDLEETCSFYTRGYARSLNSQFGTDSCSDSVRAVRAHLRGKELNAFSEVKVMDVEVTGDTATVKYSVPKEVEELVPGGGIETQEMAQVDGEWKLSASQRANESSPKSRDRANKSSPKSRDRANKSSPKSRDRANDRRPPSD